MTLQEKITQYTQKAPHGSLLGHALVSRPKHAQLPDYPYGYTVRSIKADKTTFVYSQIMWDFLPISKQLVGLKEDDFPWDNEEIAWVQGSEVLDVNNPTDQQKIDHLLDG